MPKNKKEYDSKKLVKGIAGYIRFGMQNQVLPEAMLMNISHDIFGYIKDGKEPWFSPRTESYEEFLTEEQRRI